MSFHLYLQFFYDLDQEPLVGILQQRIRREGGRVDHHRGGWSCCGSGGGAGGGEDGGRRLRQVVPVLGTPDEWVGENRRQNTALLERERNRITFQHWFI